MLPVQNAATLRMTLLEQRSPAAVGNTRADGQRSTGVFSGMLQAAQQQIKATDTAAQQAVTGLLSGQGVEVHDAMIATEKADLTFQLAHAGAQQGCCGLPADDGNAVLSGHEHSHGTGNTTAMGRSNARRCACARTLGHHARGHSGGCCCCAQALCSLLSAISTWWSTRTDWRTLFSGMEGRDAAAMQQQLTAAGIAYQTTPDGTALQVPVEQLDKARVAISAGGLPQSGRMGFELFDKPNWIGSEFDEKVNYRRALEGELEHTIGSLESVRSARVHIVLPKQGAFASEDQPSKASAVLKLRRANLPREQSDAIRNLIAGSVEGLKPEAVTLVDADGRTDLSPNSRSGQDRENELALQNKLIQVLEPLAGNGNVHATVSISYVEGSEERTDEVYDPQSAIPVSTQRTEQTSQATRPGGIAGASSNTPAAQPAPATPAGGPNAAVIPSTSSCRNAGPDGRRPDTELARREQQLCGLASRDP